MISRSDRTDRTESSRSAGHRSPARGTPVSKTGSARSPLEIYRPDLAERLVDLDSPPYRQKQVFEHLLRRPLEPFSQATALPSEFRASLDELRVSTLELKGRQSSTDGTTKLLLSATDGSLIETVVMPYQKRTTVCISSQVGCPVGCHFCATGAMGFTRNLSVAEIVDQVRLAAAVCGEDCGRISNLVYMGMGEPLLNLEAVLASIRIFTDERALYLSRRSISVSTAGIPAGILRLARAEPQVNLALSMHASTDSARAQLIPKRYRHPLSTILDACWKHFSLTRRKLLVEYVLLGGINDSREDARRLAALLRGHVVTVNLLSWNQIGPGPCLQTHRTQHRGPGSASANAFEPSSAAATALFRDVLLRARIETVVRQGRGVEIQAACGQLAGRRGGYGEPGQE